MAVPTSLSATLLKFWESRSTLIFLTKATNSPYSRSLRFFLTSHCDQLPGFSSPFSPEPLAEGDLAWLDSSSEIRWDYWPSETSSMRIFFFFDVFAFIKVFGNGDGGNLFFYRNICNWHLNLMFLLQIPKLIMLLLDVLIQSIECEEFALWVLRTQLRCRRVL